MKHVKNVLLVGVLMIVAFFASARLAILFPAVDVAPPAPAWNGRPPALAAPPLVRGERRISTRQVLFPCERPLYKDCTNDLLSANEITLEGTRDDWAPFIVCADFQGATACYPITDLFPKF